MNTDWQRSLCSVAIDALFAVFSIVVQISPTKCPRAAFFINKLAYQPLLSIRSATMKIVKDESNAKQPSLQLTQTVNYGMICYVLRNQSMSQHQPWVQQTSM